MTMTRCKQTLPLFYTLLLAVASGLLPCPVAGQAAETRAEITGFQKFRFGMSEDEVKKLTQFDNTWPPGSGVQSSAELYHGLGLMNFRLTFFFENKILHTVKAEYEEDLTG